MFGDLTFPSVLLLRIYYRFSSQFVRKSYCIKISDHEMSKSLKSRFIIFETLEYILCSQNQYDHILNCGIKLILHFSDASDRFGAVLSFLFTECLNQNVCLRMQPYQNCQLWVHCLSSDTSKWAISCGYAVSERQAKSWCCHTLWNGKEWMTLPRAFEMEDSMNRRWSVWFLY